VEDKQIKSMRSCFCFGKRGLLSVGARTRAWILEQIQKSWSVSTT